MHTTTDSRPLPVQHTPDQAAGEPSPRRGRHAVFLHRVRALGLPRNGGDPVTFQCPQCGERGALADRVGATIYGSHDGGSQCGWVDTLRVGRGQRGATTLT